MSERMSALNVALVGYGLAGRVFHAPLIVATEGLRLHTVVSRQHERVLQEHPGARVVAQAIEAFDDDAIDLVVVAAPNALHAPLAMAALERGRHVVVDKPFAVTLDEAERMVACAQRHRRIVSVFHNRRWDADFLTLRQLLEDGALGEPVELHSHFDRYRPQPVDRWRERDEPGGGLWFDLGPHLIDQALQLFGPPQSLQADIGRQRKGGQGADFFHAVLRYPRLRVFLHAGSLVAANGLRFAAHGTLGSYVKHGTDAQEAMLRRGGRPGDPGWGEDPLPGRLTRVGDDGTLQARELPAVRGDYRRYYAALRAAIAGDGPLPVTAAQALQVMRLLELGLRSSAEQRALPLH